jgi:negative regulator of sigma-B (phosphoserine phosphatase)
VPRTGHVPGILDTGHVLSTQYRSKSGMAIGLKGPGGWWTSSGSTRSPAEACVSRSGSMCEPTAPRIALEVGSAVKPFPGEFVSGDVVVSTGTRRGRLVALIDGLGHGPGAAEAAGRAADAFSENAELPLGELFAVVDRELRGTRGAVASAASFDVECQSFEFAGIGNVAARLVAGNDPASERATPLVRPGVLGSAFRSVTSQRMPFEEGDVLLLYSDGVRSRFDALALRLLDARAAAEDVIAMAGRDNDDASCIVVRGIAPSLEAPVAPVAPSAPGIPERRVPIRVSGDAQVAAFETRRVAAELGMPARSQWEAGIAAAELASNALKYGSEGVLTLRVMRGEISELVIEVSDRELGLSRDPTKNLQSFPKRGTRLVARKRFKP